MNRIYHIFSSKIMLLIEFCRTTAKKNDGIWQATQMCACIKLDGQMSKSQNEIIYLVLKLCVCFFFYLVQNLFTIFTNGFNWNRKLVVSSISSAWIVIGFAWWQKAIIISATIISIAKIPLSAVVVVGVTVVWLQTSITFAFIRSEIENFG